MHARALLHLLAFLSLLHPHRVPHATPLLPRFPLLHRNAGSKVTASQTLHTSASFSAFLHFTHLRHRRDPIHTHSARRLPSSNLHPLPNLSPRLQPATNASDRASALLTSVKKRSVLLLASPQQCCDDGFTLDSCRDDSECRGDRFCTPLADADGDQASVCVPETGPCFCLFADAETPLCVDSSACEVGEVCSSINNSSDATCISEEVVENNEEFEEVGGGGADACCDDGFTFDPCTSSVDCLGERECRQAGDDARMPCTPSADFCVCVPLQPIFCTGSSECESGELCAVSFEAIYAFCVSEEFVDNADGLFEVGPGSNDPPAPTGPDPRPPFDPGECCNNGFTLDVCMSSVDCRGDRDCVQVGTVGIVACVPSSSYCVCAPPTSQFTVCADSSECEVGEVCVFASNEFFASCISRELTENVEGFVENGPASRGPDSLRTEPVSKQQFDPPCCNDGFTLDFCSSSADCRGDRNCLQADYGVDELCRGGAERCFCTQPEDVLCTSSSECEAGEVCASSLDTPTVCMSEEMVEFNGVFEEVGAGNDAASALCIDAEALAHLPLERLIFKEHAMGRVLCDGAGSCATAGHIVVFKGQAMMMRTYCELVECERRELYVNSPRYKRGMRVKSRTKGLEFTAFAARWETLLEERLFKVGVDIGL